MLAPIFVVQAQAMDFFFEEVPCLTAAGARIGLTDDRNKIPQNFANVSCLPNHDRIDEKNPTNLAKKQTLTFEVHFCLSTKESLSTYGARRLDISALMHSTAAKNQNVLAQLLNAVQVRPRAPSIAVG